MSYTHRLPPLSNLTTQKSCPKISAQSKFKTRFSVSEVRKKKTISGQSWRLTALLSTKPRMMLSVEQTWSMEDLVTNWHICTNEWTIRPRTTSLLSAQSTQTILPRNAKSMMLQRINGKRSGNWISHAISILSVSLIVASSMWLEAETHRMNHPLILSRCLMVKVTLIKKSGSPYKS